MTRLLRLASFLLVALGPELASAAVDDPPLRLDWDGDVLPDVPAPPSLPDLTHRGLTLGFDTTMASIQPMAPSEGGRPPRVFGIVERIEAEQAISIRRWYVGGALAFVGQSKKTHFAVSQPEVWGRAVWANKAGLAFGGGLGVVIPAFDYADSTKASLVERHVRIVRPWDEPSFSDQTFTFRPLIDVRAIDGPVLLQLRQGIDWSLPISGGDALLASRTTFYVGYGIANSAQIGLEATEVYYIVAPNVNDDERANYSLSPSFRYMTESIQPGISAVFPLDQTILGIADSFWAVRVHVAWVL